MSDIQSLAVRVQDLTRSVDQWNTYMIWALLATAIAAIFVAITTREVIVRSRQLASAQADLLKQDLKEKDLKIAEANVVQEELRKQNLSTASELEKERIRRLELEGKVAWRRLSEEQQLKISERLKQFAGLEVHIIFTSGDMEGKSFANDILSALTKAKWHVPYKPGAVLNMAPFGAKYKGEENIDTGVSIVSSKEEIGRKAAEAFVHELTLLGYDAVNKGPFITEKEASARPMVEIRVYARPEAAQGHIKLMHKE